MVIVGICDDEKQQRSQLHKIVQTYLQLAGENYEIRMYPDAEQLLADIKKDHNCLDVLFLDIELGGMNGVEAARMLRRYTRDLILVFITGYEDYVFNGYEVGALNYIMKPYRQEKIKEVLKEAMLRLNKCREHFITVRNGTQICRFHTSDILYLASDLRKITICTRDTAFEFYGKLSDLEQKLPSTFARTHQRYLVNLEEVERIDNKFAVIHGKAIPVSKSRYQEVAGRFARLMLEM
ncbi:LytTR family DNA-binding domain-containing protein [Diplocloster hominis]|uniref:LytR/AlgR family response regulator transcription factor n=1 Tax=Diplocloster hominis TaxID=3079010 RepID=UPI0031BAB870